MFQYLLSFLLINSYYQSLGSPIQSNHSIINSLTDLSDHCQNLFLSSTIKSKYNDCNVPVPPYNKKQIRCLIFYDINKQLCSAVVDSKLEIKKDKDFIFKIQSQDVNTLCTEAKDWVFTNITTFDQYKIESEQVFKSPISCGEICGGDENYKEANYFCKYYKWGVELLKSHMSTVNITKANLNTQESIGPINPLNSNVADTNISHHQKQDQIQQTETSILKSTPEKTDVSGADNNDQNVLSEKAPSSPAVNQDNGVLVDNKEDEDNVNALENSVQENNVDVSDPSKKLSLTTKLPTAQNDPMIIPGSGKGSKDHIEVDPQENVDGRSQGDSEYAGFEGVDDENEIQESEHDKNTDKKLENSKIDLKSHKVFYPNTSDGFSDDGDHFFPFFLTGIILVVLLYVLYHNKNKVSKVFFGLLVEGRQNGRRRNSRGHAYRRLDTLEQAMSADTSAPPSKIIY